MATREELPASPFLADPPKTRPLSKLIVARITPQNLERGVLWFSEHARELAHAARSHPWWRNNLLVIECDLIIRPSELSRRLLDFGYDHAQRALNRGLYAHRGGIVEVWPINADRPYAIEFEGNSIIAIYLGELHEQQKISTHQLQQERITSLPEGSFAVHEDHGIGIFRGIDSAHEFFIIDYAPPREGVAPDRLFVPFAQENRVAPYVGFENPRVHRLGGAVWEHTKRKIREETEKLARELLLLYAQREETLRPAQSGDSVIEEEVRARFPFTETEDQITAEREIMADLASPKPMDRILCGDVGFGKTELAMRAAARAVASGNQVALLAPTTVLVSQHEEIFTRRFEGLPITVRTLSRLTPPRDRSRIEKEIATGKADIIIGTHRILSPHILFKNLGLAIIDEEQRFGVKQKEMLKNIHNQIDILSLSATPIPRTLQFTLAHLRKISLLSTPPSERVPIATFVLPYSTRLIRDAIVRELARGGQVYILHNRVETIGHAKEKLEKILRTKGVIAHADPPPLPVIGVIHGRMPERELVRTMQRFRAGEINILLATTIIENGLDISSANTLIVEDATRLGLAQAHQLRGRIGRGNAHAFAYFLFRTTRLTDKSRNRLEALQEYATLGAGYALALRDLEIRGTGNILGREQSGTAYKVGLNLYYQMLAEAVENINAPHLQSPTLH